MRTRKKKGKVVSGYAQLWPRDVFDMFAEEKRNKLVLKECKPLQEHGVYVLYRDDHPDYVGRALVSQNVIPSRRRLGGYLPAA